VVGYSVTFFSDFSCQDFLNFGANPAGVQIQCTELPGEANSFEYSSDGLTLQLFHGQFCGAAFLQTKTSTGCIPVGTTAGGGALSYAVVQT